MGANRNPHYSLIGQMFKRDYQWLCASVGRVLGCHHSAQDIASETFVRVLALPDPTAIREPRALLTTIARRLVYEGWRRQDLGVPTWKAWPRRRRRCTRHPRSGRW